jgi:PBCV-specific basic adaptor domain
VGDDKTVGTDDKGRTIYEGPRGGQYYINSNGNKTYLKADKKIN